MLVTFQWQKTDKPHEEGLHPECLGLHRSSSRLLVLLFRIHPLSKKIVEVQGLGTPGRQRGAIEGEVEVGGGTEVVFLVW